MSHKNCPTRKFLLQHMLAFSLGNLNRSEWGGDLERPYAKVFAEYTRSPLRLSPEGDLNRFEQGCDLREKEVFLCLKISTIVIYLINTMFFRRRVDDR